MLTTNKVLEIFQELDLYLDELTEENYQDRLIDPLMDAVDRELLPEFEIFTGASKVVLSFMDTDFVIKIPFNGTVDSVYDEETDDYCYSEFVPFCGAGEYYEDNAWDYCNLEVERFQAALDEEVDECFVETIYIGSVNHYPIYAQELVEMYDYSEHDFENSNKADELEKTSSLCKSNKVQCFHTNWLTDARKYYGEDFLIKLLKFIDNYCISDLHSGNLGYICGRPMIVDYASFEG